VRVILVVLALIWVVALTPTILRKLAEREFTYSVARFHRSLRVMRQVHPNQVTAAGAAGGLGVGASGASRVTGLRSRGSYGIPLRPPVASASTSAVSMAALRSSGPTARRRRRVLGVLAGSLAGSFLLGFVPTLGAFWDVSLFLLAVTAAYVALLIHFRRVAVERAQKVVPIERGPQLEAVAAETVPGGSRVRPYRATDARSPYLERIGAVRISGEVRERRPAVVVVG
jgi:hypothetical protein